MFQHRDEYVAKLEGQLHDWAGRVQVLTARAEKLTADARSAAENQIEDGRQKLAVARRTVDDLKAVGSDKFDEARATLESFWKDVCAVFEASESAPVR